MELADDILLLVVVLLEHERRVQHELRFARPAVLLLGVSEEIELLPWLVSVLDVEQNKV